MLLNNQPEIIMFHFKRKSKLDKLKQKYKRSMRDSFNLALKDRQKSLLARQEAREIQKQIDLLEAQNQRVII